MEPASGGPGDHWILTDESLTAGNMPAASLATRGDSF
jgi:hypothetical protein